MNGCAGISDLTTPAILKLKILALALTLTNFTVIDLSLICEVHQALANTLILCLVRTELRNGWMLFLIAALVTLHRLI